MSFLSIDGTLTHQAVVMTLNGVFDDGGEGDGLIGALAKLLNGRDQFHRVVTDPNAELLGSVWMVVCHFCWGDWLDSGGEDHQHQQHSRFSS